MTTVREGGGGGTIMDMEYRFSATQNNGKITQQKDWVSGEEVTYQYDSLQRLIAATTTGPEWGQSFGYDGFGNLLSKSVTKGSAPALSINVDGATNRITTSRFGYDANGNMTAMPGQTGIAFDALNRLTTASGDQYSYRPDNKRLWKKLPGGAEEIYFYSIMGERWGAYQPIVSGPSLYLKRNSESLFFAGTMIRSQGQAVVTDRQGSVRSFGGTSIRYFPYGEEQTSTANEKNKFGTYFRDGTTGLDYADQRYYGSSAGRFLSSDPSEKTPDGKSSQSWNRYGYVEGDPANRRDPRGLEIAPPEFGPGDFPYLSTGTWPWDVFNSGEWPWAIGINCYFVNRYGEDSHCWEWRIIYFSWAAFQAAHGGDGPPECEVELHYRPVAYTPIGNHTYVRVIVTGAIATLSFASRGANFVIEGQPEYTPPVVKVTGPIPGEEPVFFLLDFGRLMIDASPNGKGNSPGDPKWGSVKGTSICQGVAKMLVAMENYMKSPVNYSPIGQNCNAATSYLLGQGGLSGHFSSPPQSWGWGTPLRN